MMSKLWLNFRSKNGAIYIVKLLVTYNNQVMYVCMFVSKYPKLNLHYTLIKTICCTCMWENNEAQVIETLRIIFIF